MKKYFYFFFFLGIILLPNGVNAEPYERFDSIIEEINWHYRPLDESLEFSVLLRNLEDKGNFIVHFDIDNIKNPQYSSETYSRVLHVETGFAKWAEFSYHIKKIDDLSINTWINPPATSENPTHIFDQAILNISRDEILEKVFNAINGEPLSFSITPNEISTQNIYITNVSDRIDSRGIRVISTGNSEVCENFILKIGERTLGEFSGQRFFDRIVDLRGIQNSNEFHIVCEIKNSTQQNLDEISKQDSINENLFAREVDVNCSGSICIHISNYSEPEDPIVIILVAAITGIISLVVYYLKSRQWSKRQYDKAV